MAISAVLVVFADDDGRRHGEDAARVDRYDTGAITNGVAPTVTPSRRSSTGARRRAARARRQPAGQLAYNTTTLAAGSSHVTIDFTNQSPRAHNVTIANASGKVLGPTPTFTGGDQDAVAQPAARHLHLLLLGPGPRAGRHEGHAHRSLSASKPAHSSTGSARIAGEGLGLGARALAEREDRAARVAHEALVGTQGRTDRPAVRRPCTTHYTL